ncbi:MAG: AAA family ATPase [Thiohalocapsa sp.]|uniref:AAA family ATPase n=1 Tax=Thiohalocapsa sp. TaxID=2497641 RepID=UPI0025CD18F6|nr:AAA family ATPase [Thiohalocapsa sp.]MCG6940133.1 AAA family ATPase [Thiohalocapsa sp.]
MRSDLHDLQLMLRSETPLLLIESREEPRILNLFLRIGGGRSEPVFCWTVTDGLRPASYGLPQPQLADPAEALRHIKATTQSGIYVLLDFHPFLDHPLHVRLIKEIAQDFHTAPRRLVLLSHALMTPPELKHLAARVELSLPDRRRLLALIREEAQAWQHAGPNRSFRANRDAVEQLSRNLLGITESDARRLIRNAIRNDGAITESDVADVTRAKYKLLSPEGAVAFEYDTASFADVAGLHNLKRFVDRRRAAFLDGGGSDAGVGTDVPKGIMLLGVQGGGKSLAAKAVAGRLGVPLLRLDFGALYNKYIGESERNLREALRTADVMAPCVLWCDEIEKGIASGQGDEGTPMRLLGALLTWMAERTTRVFLVATSNDISGLPPELVRKGRLDEIFFVDLPDAEVRAEIFRIHLAKRGLDPAQFDLGRLAEASAGFTGAGLEQAVVSARYAARAEDRAPDTDAVLAELAATQPLSVVMGERIAQLRAWALERTVSA